MWSTRELHVFGLGEPGLFGNRHRPPLHGNSSTASRNNIVCTAEPTYGYGKFCCTECRVFLSPAGGLSQLYSDSSPTINNMKVLVPPMPHLPPQSQQHLHVPVEAPSTATTFPDVIAHLPSYT